ncbi:ferric reductase like transmembrane component-domain-containing protein [Mycena vitilis]|nr:ferric reductase like transmembrane component-domain-containing protein [Mycena vitilis]
MDHGTPPAIPQELQQYNSYVEDPKWQQRFTLMWSLPLALLVLCAVPRVVRGLRTGMGLVGLIGVGVGVGAGVQLVVEEDKKDNHTSRTGTQRTLVGDKPAQKRRPWRWMHLHILCWSVPGVDLNLGQLLVVLAYSSFVLVSMIYKAPLSSNPNRAGFLALAQLPPVFLFAMKNSPLALLLGPGVDYAKLNYMHRWAGRGLFLGAVVHGALWIQNHLTYNIPILTRQKEGSGVAAMGCLCLIVLTSVAPLRRWCYSLFLVVHSLTFPAFFVTICYHTPFATPWIFPPLAFYAVDVLLRLLKLRIVVARVRACPGGMSVISIPAATTGWRGGQHVQLRTLLGGGGFAQSHPLSILCAPPETTCLSPPPGLLLAARACGPWSRALYSFGSADPPARVPSRISTDEDGDDEDTLEGSSNFEFKLDAEFEFQQEEGGRALHATVDGPYGGPTRDAGEYGTVLFLAGGSGATATLGALDDLVGRCVRRRRVTGECTRTVEWVWCVRDADALGWFAPQLAQIAAMAAGPGSGLMLRIRIFVTGDAPPASAVAFPGCEVCYNARSGAWQLLDELLDIERNPGKGDVEHAAGHAARVAGTDGFAIFAAGPRGLVREAGNAVARTNLLRTAAVEFCSEAFVI